MSLSLPTSLGGIGALCMGIAVLLTLFGHARKVALVLAIIGGLGISGAIGSALAKAVGAGTSGTAHLTSALFGSSVPLLFLIGLGLWFWHLFKGGGGTGKFKKWIGVFVAAAVGVVLGATVPAASGFVQDGAHTTNTTLTSFTH